MKHKKILIRGIIVFIIFFIWGFLLGKESINRLQDSYERAEATIIQSNKEGRSNVDPKDLLGEKEDYSREGKIIYAINTGFNYGWCSIIIFLYIIGICKLIKNKKTGLKVLGIVLAVVPTMLVIGYYLLATILYIGLSTWEF